MKVEFVKKTREGSGELTFELDNTYNHKYMQVNTFVESDTHTYSKGGQMVDINAILTSTESVRKSQYLRTNNIVYQVEKKKNSPAGKLYQYWLVEINGAS